MWNPPFGYQTSWQGPQFPQANFGQPVAQQPLGLNQQGLANRPPTIPQPHVVYNNMSQTPQNPNGVAITMPQQHRSPYPPNARPLLQTQLPRPPSHVQPNNSQLMHPRIIPPPPINAQFPRPPMHVNQSMEPRGAEGRRPSLLPFPTNTPFSRIPAEVDQGVRIRPLMTTGIPSLMHNLPPPNMHSVSVNGNSQRMVPLATREPPPPGTFESQSDHFTNLMQMEPQRNVSHTQPLADIIGSDQTGDQQRVKDALMQNKDHRELYHDEMDTSDYKYGLSPAEIDSIAYFADNEVFSRESGKTERLRNHFSKPSPSKKPEKSPLKNDQRREDHEFSRKRGSEKRHSSSRDSHKQPKYDGDLKHIDHDKRCNPHDSEKSSSSSQRKDKKSSSHVDHDKDKSANDKQRYSTSSEGKSRKSSSRVDHAIGDSTDGEQRCSTSSEGKSRKSSQNLDHVKSCSLHDGKRIDISSKEKSKASAKESKSIDHGSGYSPQVRKTIRTSSDGKSKTSIKDIDDKGSSPNDHHRGTSSEGITRSRDVNDKGHSPCDQRRGSVSSEQRRRTSSSSSNSSQRRKDLFTSPKTNSLDRHRDNTRHHREGRPLRCVSPPAPDVKRVVKFIIPDEYYTLSKSKKDSKSVCLGTQKLEELYETFENKILNPAAEDGELDSEEQSLNSKEEHLKDSPDSEKMNVDDDIFSDSESLDDFELREQQRKGQYSADTFNDANDSDESGEDDDDDDDKYDVDDDASDSSADEAGVSAKEIRARKLSDPRRLHQDLWFNEKGEGNDGPVCRCSAKDKEHGIQHFVYPGEKSIPLCSPLGNNADRLYHYWVTVTPHTNFMTELPTTIKYHDRDYVFEGFSILSHQSLDKVPLCSLIRFNIEFSIHLVREPIPMNFCIKGLEMISKFLFSDVLELLDWSLKGKEGERESCPIFHFMPRFVYRKKESQNGKEVHELLPMNKVISYFIESSEALVKPENLKMSKQKEKSLSKSCRNQIVRKPNKKPAAFRIDDLEFEDEDNTEHDSQRTYPLAVHHGIRPVQMSYSGNAKYQQLWKSFLRLRNTAANRPVHTRKYQDRLVEMKVKLEKMRLNSSMRRDVEVKVSSQGLMKTGIHSDICQHAMLLPVLVHHLRYHNSLRTLDENIGYQFKDRMLLQLSLSHPSYHLNFGMNPDQARNTLSNCGVKHPRYGDRRVHRIHTKKKGITQLIRVMANLGKIEEYHSMIRHNERLEFLGDAVLEFICSSHLYFMLPDMTEGHLASFRSALVQNSHLAHLAKRLNLSDYMQYAHGPDLCKEEDMNHAIANCFEALLGAIFLESGLQAAVDFFTHVAFENEEIRNVWVDLPKHPLQSQQPQGDRHLIPSSPVLQKLHELEEAIGITFKHIRLLARAFTHPQVGFNNLTLGDNQRMEFLGDSVLQFVVSIYLYRHFPEHHEGHLTLLRSSLVNNRTQADIARQLGLDEYINFGSSGPKNIREKLLADVLEAFLAALYVDKGLKHVEAFCRSCFFPRVEDNIVNQEWIDAKSQLQQCCLSMREEGKTPDLPEYRVLQDTGPAHRKRYQIVVYYKGKRCGKGEGLSIHQAEMAAASDALSSSYFPELARQKHYLDDKHQTRRTRQHNRSSRPSRDRPDEQPPIQEPIWVDNE